MKKGFVAYPKESLDTGAIYKKYKNGDHITDDELEYAIHKFNILVKEVEDLNSPTFALFWRELYNVKVEFESYKEARKRNNFEN